MWEREPACTCAVVITSYVITGGLYRLWLIRTCVFHIGVCIYVCMYVCMYLCMYVYVCVCVSVCARVRIYVSM